MQKKRLIFIMATLALMAGIWLLTGERQSPSEDSASGQRLFPGLEQVLDDIRRIRVEHSGTVYDVVKAGDQWQLQDKGGYPVLFERVKPMLLGIALLEKVEPKTDRPKNYARLGVQEPAVDTANTRIELYTMADNPVASLIVGGVQAGLITGGKDGIYARVSGQPRAWLVAGHLDLAEKPVDWVDRQFTHIKPKTVKRVTIIQPDGSRLVVEKSRQGAPSYTVMNLPEGAALKQGVEVNTLARGLAALKMDDVFVHNAIHLAESAAVTAVFETWDGLRITAHTLKQDKKTLVWLDTSMTAQATPARLHARLDGWVYQIPNARADRLRMRLDDLVESSVAE